MISEIAHKIINHLEKNEIINKEDEDVYIYGVEIFISTLITFAIVIIIGIIMNCFFASLIYFLIFAVFRQICGGYHAKTYFKCNLIFMVTTFMVLSAYKFIPVIIIEFLHYLIIVFWILSVFIFAPVENANKPISEEKKCKLKLISRVMCIFITIITCLIYIKKIQYAVLIDATLFVVALSMAVVGFRKDLQIKVKSKIDKFTNN